MLATPLQKTKNWHTVGCLGRRILKSG